MSGIVRYSANRQEDINFTWHNERRLENPEETFNLKPMTSEFLEKMQSFCWKDARVSRHGSECGDEKSHQHNSWVGSGGKRQAMEKHTFAPDLNVDHIVPRTQFRKKSSLIFNFAFVLRSVPMSIFLRLKSFKLKFQVRIVNSSNRDCFSSNCPLNKFSSFCHENFNFEQCFDNTFTWKFDFALKSNSSEATWIGLLYFMFSKFKFPQTRDFVFNNSLVSFR